MEYDDLVTVYTVADAVTAEIIKNALQAEGIACFLENENQAGEAGILGLAVKVQVRAGDADRARKFILAHEKRRH
jgi:hypothetical protein